MIKPTKKSLQNITPHNLGESLHSVIFNPEDAGINKNLLILTKSQLNPEKDFDWHVHDDFDEIFITVSGEGTVEFKDGTSFEFKAGDTVNCPAKLEHRIINSSKSPIEFYFIRLAS